MAAETMAFMNGTNNRLETLESFMRNHDAGNHERSDSEKPVTTNITAGSSPPPLMETDDPLFAAASSSTAMRVVRAAPKSQFIKKK